MISLRRHSVRVNLALGGLLLGLVTALTACEEDGKTAPATCAEPPLAIYDIQTGGARDGDDKNPCTTDVGHAISSIGTPTAGTASGGTATAGTSSGGKAGSGGTTTVDAGAGGAGGAGGAP
jgi:hypothetical protein